MTQQELTPREVTVALLDMRERQKLTTPRILHQGEPRRSAAGPTSRAVKLKDPAMTAMIDAALKGKAAKPEEPKMVNDEGWPKSVAHEGKELHLREPKPTSRLLPPEQTQDGLPELERLYTAWKDKCIVGEPLVEIPNHTVLVDPAGRILIELRHLIDLLKEQRP